MTKRAFVSNTPLADVELRDPAFSALLAWCIPGLGHLYQGRVGKGLLFLVCLWGTFFVGLALGRFQNVYIASGQYSYVCQFFIGLAALPALLQPVSQGMGLGGILGSFQAAPDPATLQVLHGELGKLYEIGCLYTMVAGLLNILAIYDAYAGPVYTPDEPEQDGADARDDAASQEATP